MNKVKNIIVTGSNKGIGQGIVAHLAKNDLWNIIMAVRNVQLGNKTRQNILTANPNAKITVEKLDISDFKSIEQFVYLIQEKYQNIDILLNNAGVAVKGDTFDTQVFDYTFKTNFYGTVELSEKLLPYISNNGKIITVGSMMGKMTYNRIKNQDLKKIYRNPNLTKNQIFDLAKQFKQTIADNTFEAKGWPKTVYGVSKLSINLFCNVLSRSQQVIKRGIQVYSCCPGYVATDMTSHKGVLPVSEGIKTPVFLVQLPFQINPKYQGQFFQTEKLSSNFEDII